MSEVYGLSQKDFGIVWSCKWNQWVIYRIDGEAEQHAHFNEKKGCELLIEFIEDRVKPYNKYFRQAMKRVLTEEEFNKMGVDGKKKKNKKIA